jgi:hypothetical protein
MSKHCRIALLLSLVSLSRCAIYSYSGVRENGIDSYLNNKDSDQRYYLYYFHPDSFSQKLDKFGFFEGFYKTNNLSEGFPLERFFFVDNTQSRLLPKIINGEFSSREDPFKSYNEYLVQNNNQISENERIKFVITVMLVREFLPKSEVPAKKFDLERFKKRVIEFFEIGFKEKNHPINALKLARESLKSLTQEYVGLLNNFYEKKKISPETFELSFTEIEKGEFFIVDVLISIEIELNKKERKDKSYEEKKVSTLISLLSLFQSKWRIHGKKDIPILSNFLLTEIEKLLENLKFIESENLSESQLMVLSDAIKKVEDFFKKFILDDKNGFLNINFNSIAGENKYKQKILSVIASKFKDKDSVYFDQRNPSAMTSIFLYHLDMHNKNNIDIKPDAKISFLTKYLRLLIVKSIELSHLITLLHDEISCTIDSDLTVKISQRNYEMQYAFMFEFLESIKEPIKSRPILFSYTLFKREFTNYLQNRLQELVLDYNKSNSKEQDGLKVSMALRLAIAFDDPSARKNNKNCVPYIEEVSVSSDLFENNQFPLKFIEKATQKYGIFLNIEKEEKKESSISISQEERVSKDFPFETEQESHQIDAYGLIEALKCKPELQELIQI